MRVIFSVTKNPLNPTDSTDIYTVDVPEGETVTINGWIAKNLEPLARVASVVNTINGCNLSKSAMENAYVLPDKWDSPLNDGDCVMLSPVIGAMGWEDYLIMVIISIIVGVGIGLLMRQDLGDGTGTQSVYSLSGLKNEMRKGKPVEYQCGKLKRFPAQWAKPYSIYKDNKQWLYAQLCLGIGHFDIEDLSQADLEAACGFEDTPLTNYDDYTLRLYTEGDAPLLFENNVVTSSEVDSLDLYATDQYKSEDDDWDRTQDGAWTDWYVANDFGTSANKLLLDFVCPGGIYSRTSKGKKVDHNVVTCEIQYRSFTYNNGVKTTGSAHTITFTKTGWHPAPLRFTKEISTGSGSWEVRCRRTSGRYGSVTDGRGSDNIQWNALRAVLPSLTSITEDVTVLMLKIKASNKLTSAASVRFYSIPTAKKPTYDSENGTWDDDNPVATRNAALAFCDFMRNKYCGNYPDKYLDMDNISEWITWCEDNECWFDYVFDESQDAQTQLEIITRVMRCSLWIKNNKLRLVRDEPVSIPLAVHTKENIVAGSVKVQYSAPKESDYDGYSCEFTNTDTWDTDTVIAKLADEDGSNPETLNISGITDRTRVWRQAMYERSVERYRNKAITYETTDMTAATLSVYSPIYFNHPLLSGRGVSAGIVSIDGTTIVLNQNVRLNTDEGVTNNLFIMSPSTGGVLSVHACSYADSGSGDYHTLTLDTAPDTTGMVFNDPQALPICCIGAGNNYASLVQVSKITPKDSTVELEVFPYDARIFAYDNQYPDTVANNTTPETIPDAPENVVIGPSGTTSEINFVGIVDGIVDGTGSSYLLNTDGSTIKQLSGTYISFEWCYDSVNCVTYIGSGANFYSLEDGSLTLLSSSFSNISGMSYYDGTVYIVDRTSGSVTEFSISNGTFNIIYSGTADICRAVVVGTSLYVANGCSTYGNKIYKISLSEGSISEFCSDDSLYKIQSMTTDGTYLYVCPLGNGDESIPRISKIDLSSASITSFVDGTSAYGVGQVIYYNNNIYFLSVSEGLVNCYNMDGSLINSQSFTNPSYLIVNDRISVLSVYGDGTTTNGLYSYSSSGSTFIAQSVSSPYFLFEHKTNYTVIPDTPDDIQISWDAVSGFTNYFVQYSDDGGETWNTISASTTATTILLGSYETGTLQARVGVVLNGNVYHWGYSDSVYFPSSLTEYVWVSSDDYVPASSDDYVMSAYGDES